jgi:hypothetical protein
LTYFTSVAGVWLLCQPAIGMPRMKFHEIVLLAPMFLAVALLFTAAVAMSRLPGFGERTSSVEIGLASSFSVIFLLFVQVPWWYCQTLDLHGSRVGELKYRMLSWFMLSATAFLIGGAVAILRMAISLTLSSQDSLRWHRRHASWGTSRAAAGGVAIVRRFRAIFLSVWAVWALYVAGGSVLIVLAAVGGPLLAESPYPNELVGTTKFVIASALDRSPGEAWVTLLAHVYWIFYAALFVALHTWSLGQLWRARRRTRQRLQNARPDPATSGGLRVLEACQDLEQVAGVRIRPAVRHHSLIAAWSSSFGLLGERYVEVTSGAVETLPRAEVRASSSPSPSLRQSVSLARPTHLCRRRLQPGCSELLRL